MSIGYSDCFILSKGDLWNLLNDYPVVNSLIQSAPRLIGLIKHLSRSSNFCHLTFGIFCFCVGVRVFMIAGVKLKLKCSTSASADYPAQHQCICRLSGAAPARMQTIRRSTSAYADYPAQHQRVCRHSCKSKKCQLFQRFNKIYFADSIFMTLYFNLTSPGEYVGYDSLTGQAEVD
mgnify:CR=1 FL=1